MQERAALRRLFADGFQGLTFDEPLSPRVVFSGPNGSGKTARLRCASFALRGAPGKDGLAPFMPGTIAFVGVEATTGLQVMRKTRIRAEPHGEGEPTVLSVANSSACEPSMGERNEAQVSARIERELAPNVVALSLSELFGLTGKERRRALLSALGGSGSLDAAGALARLDASFKGDDEADVCDAWSRIRPTVARSATGDALDFLALVEGAAKAQASKEREAQKAASALASSSAGTEAKGNIEEIRAQIEAQRGVVSRLSAQKASLETLLRERTRLRRDGAELRESLPPAVSALWPDPAAKEKLLEIVRETAAALEAHEKEKIAAATESATLGKKMNAAAKALGKANGRLAALVALANADPAEGCPCCGTAPFDIAALQARIEAAKASQAKAEKTALAAKEAYDAAELECSGYAERDDAVREAAEIATSAVPDLAKMFDLLAAVKKNEEQAGGGFEEADLVAAEERAAGLDAQAEAISQAEGALKTRREAGGRAENADARRRACEAIQKAAGPGGIQGEILEGTVRKLENEMNRIWGTRARRGALAWELQDARGNPDARLALWPEQGERAVYLSELSSGEQAFAVAALVAALARMKPDSMTVALIEAGEIDEEHLELLCGALDPVEELANVLVATHLREFSVPATYEIRNLGVAVPE